MSAKHHRVKAGRPVDKMVFVRPSSRVSMCEQCGLSGKEEKEEEEEEEEGWMVGWIEGRGGEEKRESAI